MDFAAVISHVVIPILLFCLTVTLAVVGFLLRNKLGRVEKDIEAAKAKAELVDKDLMEFKAVLPRYYVLKDDYIRTISVFEKKLDDMNGNIVKLIEDK